jgi:hypothetical protein
LCSRAACRIKQPQWQTAVCRTPVRSMTQQYVFDALLMCSLKFENSSLIQKSAISFILDLLLHCGRSRRTELQQQWSTTAKATGCSSRGLGCNFSFLQECPIGGWM